LEKNFPTVNSTNLFYFLAVKFRQIFDMKKMRKKKKKTLVWVFFPFGLTKCAFCSNKLGVTVPVEEGEEAAAAAAALGFVCPSSRFGSFTDHAFKGIFFVRCAV
jgi:hypothetical protein